MPPSCAVMGVELSAALPLPPRALASIPIVARTSLLSRACLIDGQHPSPQRRPMKPVDRGLSLSGVGHLDKTKAPRAAGVAVRHDLGAVDDAIRFEQLTQLFFRRRKGNVSDKDTHGSLLLCSRLSSTPCWSITAGVFS